MSSHDISNHFQTLQIALANYDEKGKMREERKGDDLVKVQLWYLL